MKSTFGRTPDSPPPFSASFCGMPSPRRLNAGVPVSLGAAPWALPRWLLLVAVVLLLQPRLPTRAAMRRVMQCNVLLCLGEALQCAVVT